MNQLNVVYFSASGTTKAIAATLTENLRGEITEYDLLRQSPEQPVVFEKNTPVIFALPVFAGCIPALCVDSLKKFKGDSTPAVAVVVYGNREYDDALLELTDILKANNFVTVAAAAFIAQHSIFTVVAGGRPDSQDKEAVKIFGQKCEKAFESFTGMEKVVVKGSFPYKQPGIIPFKPTGNSKCNACGACVKICPVKAITTETPRKTDESRCTACTACIATCPQKARAFRGTLYAAAGKIFSTKNMNRREPEFFYAE